MKQALALGYVRISKDDDNSISLDYQRNEIEKYCTNHDLLLIGIEEDAGISGKSIKARPGVKRLLAQVHEKSIDAVIIYKSDRMSRDGLESLQIEKLFLCKGVSLVSTTEGELANSSPDNEFMSFIRAGLNQRERRLIAMRTKQALARLRELGRCIGSQPPYGQRASGKELVQDTGEQKTVETVKCLRKQGVSIRGIVKTLSQKGILTRKGTPFQPTQIVRILKVA